MDSTQSTPVVKSRNIVEVVNTIKTHLPAEHSQVHNSLQWITETAPYTPSEMMGNLWHRLTYELNSVLPQPTQGPLTEDWHFQVVSLLTNKPLDDVRAFYGRK